MTVELFVFYSHLECVVMQSVSFISECKINTNITMIIMTVITINLQLYI